MYKKFIFIIACLTSTGLYSKTVLIAGGAGFLGTNLTIHLLNEGHRIICIDNLLTGKESNIAQFLNNPHYTFINHDVIEPLQINEHIDWIFNLASPASPPKYQIDPIHTLKTNINGALNMLELACTHDAVILQASTSEIYGEPLEHPQKEDYWGNVNSIGIRSCYDESKRCAETAFFDYHRKYKTKIKVIRIFNTYGPYMDPEDGRVVTNFIMQALTNAPITIYGNGSQTRSFCYVDDLIEGMIAMIKSHPNITGPINLGNPGEFTMIELADLVKQFTGSKSELIFKPLPQDDPTKRKPDISRAHTLLGWYPKITLEEGLRKTIAYFQS